MMRGKFFTVSLLLQLNFVALNSAALNRSVCVVYCTDTVNDSIYAPLANALNRRGYLSAERKIKETGNAFGSGFLYKSKSGACYIVTNQHVIDGSKMVRISATVNGKSSTFNGCRVLYADTKRDLAILQVPTEIPMLPLESYDDEISDGLDVYTAGYPGLGNAPVWQLGKGIISNSAVETDVNEKDSITVIQHTAQVDFGNSGGPLLVAENSDSGKVYKVVGVNTWKVWRRSDTNLSIRVSDLDQLIDDFNNGTYIKKADFDSARTAFEADIKIGYKEAYKYVSEDLVLSLEEKTAYTMLDFADNNISALLRSSDPMVAMRMLVAKTIAKKLGSNFTMTDVSVTDSVATVHYKVKKENVSFTWKNIDNGWSIVSCSYIDIDVSKKSPTSLVMSRSGLYYTEWKNTVTLGVTFPLNPYQFYGGSIDYSCAIYNYGLFTLCFDVDVFDLNGDIKKKHSVNPSINLVVDIGVGGRLPINIKRFVLIPYATVGMGVGSIYTGYISGRATEYDFKFLGVVRPGLQFGYLVNRRCMVFAALEYTHKLGYYYYNECGTLGLRLGVGF